MIAAQGADSSPLLDWLSAPFGIPLVAGDTTWVDLAAALGSVATVLALVLAYLGLMQNTKARNLSTVVEISKQLIERREKASASGVYGHEYQQPENVHANLMLDLVEQVAFLINHGLVTGSAEGFLMDWLRGEVPDMMAQDVFKRFINIAGDGHLSEFKALAARIEEEKAMRGRSRLARILRRSPKPVATPLPSEVPSEQEPVRSNK